MLREKINDAMKEAMKAKEMETLGTIRMVMAKLKDLDIAARTADSREGIKEEQILTMLQGMIKQRRESIALYEKGNRADLAAKEAAEIIVIERFLPQQMDEAAIKAAITDAISATGASSIKDMGKVMGELKKAYTGQMDFASAGTLVKGILSGD
ncbi:MAG: GatB/YqeY domain-containing protein [Proteobacteria bacterium]|jgi:uncharacterized protein YqeY|nr:GatB/YqeY domain-containing protein [Alphaproteobacteria bacterium]NCC03291.1 GatB/YqeY domain-containing protein [Pseudomonadota bacterium]